MERTGQYDKYLQLLEDHFNAATVPEQRDIGEAGGLTDPRMIQALARLARSLTHDRHVARVDFQADNPAHHGTPEQRADAWQTGFQSGDPATCNGYLEA